MKDIIEDFYFGAINPQASTLGQNTNIQKSLQRLTKLEKHLTETLCVENKRDFLDYVNTMDEMISKSNLDSFTVGFRLGAKFTYDTFCNN